MHEVKVYITWYGWHDNDPAGSAIIDGPVLHETAGGTGTSDDPLTCAIVKGSPWHIGQRFYVPYLKQYLIAEDHNAHPSMLDGVLQLDQLDVWMDGRDMTRKESEAWQARNTLDNKTVVHVLPADQEVMDNG